MNIKIPKGILLIIFFVLISVICVDGKKHKKKKAKAKAKAQMAQIQSEVISAITATPTMITVVHEGITITANIPKKAKKKDFKIKRIYHTLLKPIPEN